MLEEADDQNLLLFELCNAAGKAITLADMLVELIRSGRTRRDLLHG